MNVFGYICYSVADFIFNHLVKLCDRKGNHLVPIVNSLDSRVISLENLMLICLSSFTSYRCVS